MKSIRSQLDPRAALATPETQVTWEENLLWNNGASRRVRPSHLHINTQVPACSSLVKEFRPAVNKVLQRDRNSTELKHLNLYAEKTSTCTGRLIFALLNQTGISTRRFLHLWKGYHTDALSVLSKNLRGLAWISIHSLRRMTEGTEQQALPDLIQL